MNACLILNERARSFDGGDSLDASEIIEAFRLTQISVQLRIAAADKFNEALQAEIGRITARFKDIQQ